MPDKLEGFPLESQLLVAASRERLDVSRVLARLAALYDQHGAGLVPAADVAAQLRDASASYASLATSAAELAMRLKEAEPTPELPASTPRAIPEGWMVHERDPAS